MLLTLSMQFLPKMVLNGIECSVQHIAKNGHFEKGSCSCHIMCISTNERWVILWSYSHPSLDVKNIFWFCMLYLGEKENFLGIDAIVIVQLLRIHKAEKGYKNSYNSRGFWIRVKRNQTTMQQFYISLGYLMSWSHFYANR